MQLPFFRELEGARSVLIAGAGGGFDILCGLPLYFGLRQAGVEVHLANYSFSELQGVGGRRLTPVMTEVTDDCQLRPDSNYFPELHLARWFASRGEPVPIYCFSRTGVRPLRHAYQTLVARLGCDAIVLVDGGTDSLMRGDEAGLGTPVEDVASIAAVHGLEVPTKLLICLGFGIDAYHGVCHAHFLQAVADLSQSGGFLGAWSLLREMPEVELYRQATDAVHQAMPYRPSIVATSILSALEGHFGNHHRTHRTQGSELFINPLMTLYWCFQLDAVARRLLYLEKIEHTGTQQEMLLVIEHFRARHEHKRWQSLPM